MRDCNTNHVAIHVLLNPKCKFVWTEGMFQLAVRHFKGLSKKTMLYQMGFKNDNKPIQEKSVFVQITNLADNLKALPDFFKKNLGP
jgi:hypothetical protein